MKKAQKLIHLQQTASGASLKSVQNFPIMFGFQVMSGHSLYLTLSVYCGMSLLAAIASLMLPIETQGKHLGDTNQNQDAKVPTTTVDYMFFSGERE